VVQPLVKGLVSGDLLSSIGALLGGAGGGGAAYGGAGFGGAWGAGSGAVGGFYHAGGLVKKLHEGGYPSIKSDETVALLQNDEYVLNRNATRSLGTGALNQLNSGRMPGGTFSVNVPVSINGMMPEAVMSEIRRDIPVLVEQETIRIMKRHM
jgi:hypothetical protein